STQLNEIIHAPEFQKLEGAWRGLEYLANTTETSTNLKIKVLNVSKKEILKNFGNNDWERSTIFRKVYEEEFGTLGGVPFAAWIDFRKSEDSKYVGLCLPHVLMRLPYGKDTTPVDEFGYEEGVDGRDHHKYLWGNAAYALGARLTDAFAKHEWCAAIRGVE